MDRNRKVAYDILYQIEVRSQYSNIALNNAFINTKELNQGFIRELVYGSLENKIYLEFIASRLAKTRIKNIPRTIRIILRLALYQLIFLDNIEEYAVVNEAVELSKKIDKNRASQVNGILRNFKRNFFTIEEELSKLREKDLLRYLSIKYSFEKYIVQNIIRDYGIEKGEKILNSLNRKPVIYIRTNLLKIDKKTLCEKLLDLGFSARIVDDTTTGIELSGKNILESSLYNEGYFSIQDKASQKLVDILNPKEGEIIGDLCAAPGGKSFASAERMKNKGRIIARDFYKEKLKRMEDEAKRLGIKNIEIEEWDAQNLDEKLIAKLDKIICDLPCSGFGVISKKPEIKFKKTEEEIKELPKKQLKILLNASEYLKDNGELIYSTCTLNKDENEAVVRKFIEMKKNFKITFEKTFTPDEDIIDGFYICKLVRG